MWALGGTPREHRSDNLSAAYRNLDADAREDLTSRYDTLCAHCRMEPTRNNRGVAHENGAIGSSHGHLKHAVRDVLLLRGAADFADLAAYRRFIDEIACRKNTRNGPRIDAEKLAAATLAADAHLRLRGDFRLCHLIGRLHGAQGLLHRALPADRASGARSAL